ncbi:MAG TPA: MFS transporter [Pseudonocardia sp.]|jgi:predicted MFS family arabinose efflux permease|uniref:MFS transporter n=1 Tax=Pseudonocardia sp. TaxID=60912 RepID=UPI002B4AFC04|nr:MFS transporter [Pseudonocardia sp.]HLU56371.1 MFS transporter [Pseudonocardia sp.]
MIRSDPRRGWLPCLLLVTFVVGTDDFVIAGLLPAIAGDLAVTEAAAGQLVTAFSITYALAAPVLAAAAAGIDRRTLLGAGLAVFALVNAVAAVAPSYPVLMALRVLAAAVAAAMTPVAFTVAAALARPERVGRAIGAVAAGLTVSLVVGVPLGSLLGAAFGWRSTFWLVAGLASAGAAAVGAALPALPGRRTGAGLGTDLFERLRPIGAPGVLPAIGATAVAATSSFATYTYLAPVVRELTGAGAERVALVIGGIGVAGALGTVLGGRATDRFGPGRTLVSALAAQVAVIAVLAVACVVGAAPFALVALCYAVWGLAGWAFNPPMNARLLRLAPEAGTEVVALNSSALYVGMALGGALGGAALDVGGVGAVLLVATAVGLVGLVLLAGSVARDRARRRRTGIGLG